MTSILRLLLSMAQKDFGLIFLLCTSPTEVDVIMSSEMAPSTCQEAGKKEAGSLSNQTKKINPLNIQYNGFWHSLYLIT